MRPGGWKGPTLGSRGHLIEGDSAASWDRRYDAAMITGTHVIIQSPEADKVRAFFRDVLDRRHVDAGDGWLIFALPPAELGVHPTDGPPRHEIYLMCDDLDATLAELADKGVEQVGGIADEGWGVVTQIRIPGTEETLPIYQPRHDTAIGI